MIDSKNYTMNEKINSSVAKRLVNLTYQKYCELFVSEYEEKIESGDMKGSFSVVQDFIKLAIKNNFILSQTYKPAKTSPEGRLFVQGPGIQKLPKKVRGILCEGIYKDYDMKNAHPQILLYLCERRNIQCDYLKKYVNDREGVLNEFCEDYAVCRDMAKTLFLKSINKSSLTKTIIRDKKTVKIKAKSFFTEFDKELKNIQTIFFSKFKKEQQQLRQQGETHNLKGKVLNKVLCTAENELLQKVRKRFNVSVLMFDGFMAEEQYPDKEAIGILNSITEDYGIKWDVKPNDISCMDYLDDLEPNSRIYLTSETSNQMGQKILDDHLNNRFITFEGECYFKTEKIWIKNKDEIRRYLYQYVANNDFVVKGENVCERFNACNELRDVIINLNLCKRNVERLVCEDTLNKICFDNGYYDFKKDKFLKDNEVNTFFRIGRDFDDTPDESIIKEIYRRILNPIFTTKIKGRENLRDYWLYQLSCRIAGKESKEWSVVMGSRNCGKGVLSDLLRSCLERYIGVSNIENFKTKTNVGDVAKSFSWLNSKQFSKLIIFNETEENERNSTISGNIIKKITGGDDIEIRTNFQDEKTIRLMGGLMVFCNDFPEVKPADANETRINYNLISKFIDKDEETEDDSINYYVKDDDLKAWIRREDVANAFFHILINALRNGKPDLNSDFKEDIKTANLKDSESSIYNKYFEVGSPDMRVANKALREFIKSNPEISALGSENKILTKIRNRFKTGTYKTGSERGLTGIKLLNNQIE